MKRFVKCWSISIVVLGSLSSPSLNGAVIGYAGGGLPGGLYSVNVSTGTSTFLTNVDATLATGGLAYLNGQFFAANFTLNAGVQPPNLYGTLDRSTGHFTIVGNQGSPTDWEALSTGPNLNTLYISEVADNTLRSVTPGGPINLIGTMTGVLNPQGIRGLAYDNVNQIMFATDYYDQTPHLYTVNLQTGATTLIGGLGLPVAKFGGNVPLVFDQSTGTLFAADSVSRSLFRLNTQTGAATVVGTVGLLGAPFGSLTWFPDPPPPPPVTPEPRSLLLVTIGLITFSIGKKVKSSSN